MSPFVLKYSRMLTLTLINITDTHTKYDIYSYRSMLIDNTQRMPNSSVCIIKSTQITSLINVLCQSFLKISLMVNNNMTEILIKGIIFFYINSIFLLITSTVFIYCPHCLSIDVVRFGYTSCNLLLLLAIKID